MRPIDADALERDGWQMSRTVRVSKDVMEIQTRKPMDFPAIEPQRMRGRWNELKPQAAGYWQCSACGFPSEAFAADQLYKFCPNCGADMRGETG